MRETEPPRVSKRLVFIQALLGLGAHLALAVPFLRRTHGVGNLNPAQRYLFVVNHVSLLDTILLGALCWDSRCYPILVLGDKRVWHASWIRRLLSGPTSFLLDREKLNPGRIRELQAFGRAGREFHLIVFPEGTRGDGVHVGSFQPGLYYIAQEARLPIVPVFIQNMQHVSTKTGRFHPIAGLRKVEVYFGKPIAAATYLPLPREEFVEFARKNIESLQPPATTSAPAMVERVVRC